MKRHHRLSRSRLPRYEPDEHGDARDQGDCYAGVAPAVGGLLDQREHRTGESECAQDGAHDVDVARSWTVGGEAGQQHERDRDRNQVDREDPPP